MFDNHCHGCNGKGWVSPSFGTAVICPVCAGTGVAKMTKPQPKDPFGYGPYEPYAPPKVYVSIGPTLPIRYGRGTSAYPPEENVTNRNIKLSNRSERVGAR